MSSQERLSQLEIKSIFETLRNRWKEQTAHLGSPTAIMNDPNYQAIIEMGDEALPYIFSELVTDPDHWFFALITITGENPISQDDLGNIHEMTKTWVDWGRQNGYVVDCD
jgi:hypothetical protein